MYLFTNFNNRLYTKIQDNKRKGKEIELPKISTLNQQQNNIYIDLNTTSSSPKKRKEKKVKEKNVLSSLFATNITENIEEEDELDQEINKYFKENIQPFDVSIYLFINLNLFKVINNLILIFKQIDILKWWDINKSLYPYLSILALKYLNIPATSAAIEGNFNSGTNIITNRRTNLQHNTRKELLILKYNNKKDKKPLKIKKYLDLKAESDSEISETDLSEGEDSS